MDLIVRYKRDLDKMEAHINNMIKKYFEEKLRVFGDDVVISSSFPFTRQFSVTTDNATYYGILTLSAKTVKKGSVYEDK